MNRMGGDTTVVAVSPHCQGRMPPDGAGSGTMRGSSPLVRATTQLVVLQLAARGFSFSLNQLLLRTTEPRALGVATLGLDVVKDTGLFLVREGLRGAVVRTRTSTPPPPLLSQTLLLPALLSPLLPVLFLLYYFSIPAPLPAHLGPTAALYALACLVELLAEPRYLSTLLRWETLTGSRVRVEGAAVATKALSTLTALLYLGPEFALPAYGVGQLVYSLTLYGGFALLLQGERQPWRVGKVEGRRWDAGTTAIAWELTKQSALKQVLTEADKIAVARLCELKDQGGYAVALNYGSLVARILFQPLEETSRLYFSTTLSSLNPTALLSAASLLSTLLLLHSHLTLIFVLLLPAYTSPLLFHLLGPRWSPPASNASTILRSYCLYLPFLAFNGLTEAFSQSVASGPALQRLNHALILSSLLFLSSFALLLPLRNFLGTSTEQTLLVASSLAMALRVGVAARFIHRFFAPHPAARGHLDWRRWTPKLGTVGVFAVVGVVVRWSEARGKWTRTSGMVEHLAVGAVGGCLGLVVIYVEEREAVQRSFDVVLKQRPKAD